jgi:hypothetical protein
MQHTNMPTKPVPFGPGIGAPEVVFHPVDLHEHLVAKRWQTNQKISESTLPQHRSGRAKLTLLIESGSRPHFAWPCL